MPPDSTHKPGPLGQAIGDYLVEAELGRGNMGVVYRVRHVHDGGLYALKVMNPLYAQEHEAVQRFLRELRILEQVRDHPGIVRVHGSGKFGQQPYFAMELVEGTSWEELLKAGQPRDEALRILGLLSDAVAYLHEQDVVHRDIKPENVVVTPEGVPLLMDFGLVWVGDASVNRLTQEAELLGTPYYMAPEQCDKARGEVSAKSDVHALGVILYRILGGVLPYRGATALEVYTRILTEEPAPIADASPEQRALIKDALAKEASKRPSAAEFQQRLTQSGGGRGDVALLVACLVLGLLGMGLGAYTYLTREAPSDAPIELAELAEGGPPADRALVAAWSGEASRAAEALAALAKVEPARARALGWELVGYGLPAPAPSPADALEKTLLSGWELAAAGHELQQRGLPELAAPAFEQVVEETGPEEPALLASAWRGIARVRLLEQAWEAAQQAGKQARKFARGSRSEEAHADFLSQLAQALRGPSPFTDEGPLAGAMQQAVGGGGTFDAQLERLREGEPTLVEGLLRGALRDLEVADRANLRGPAVEVEELAGRLCAALPHDPRPRYLRARARLIAFHDSESPPELVDGEPTLDPEGRARVELLVAAIGSDVVSVREHGGESAAQGWLAARHTQLAAEVVGLRAEGSHGSLLDDAASEAWRAEQAERHTAASAAFEAAAEAWRALAAGPAGERAALAEAGCLLEAQAHAAWAAGRDPTPAELDPARQLLAPLLEEVPLDELVELRRKVVAGDEAAELELCQRAREVPPLARAALYLRARCGDPSAARAYLGVVGDAPARAFLALRRRQLARARQLGGAELALSIEGELIDAETAAAAVRRRPQLVGVAVKRAQEVETDDPLARALLALQAAQDVRRAARARRVAALEAALAVARGVVEGEPASLAVRALALDVLEVRDRGSSLALEVAGSPQLWEVELERFEGENASETPAARVAWDRALASGLVNRQPPRLDQRRVSRALSGEGWRSEDRLSEGVLEAAERSRPGRPSERVEVASTWGDAVAPRTAWTTLAALCVYRTWDRRVWDEQDEASLIAETLGIGPPPEALCVAELGQLVLAWNRTTRGPTPHVPLYRAAVRARFRLPVAGDPWRAAPASPLPAEALAAHCDAQRMQGERMLSSDAFPLYMVGERHAIDSKLEDEVLKPEDLVRPWSRSRGALAGPCEPWLQPRLMIASAFDGTELRLAQDRGLAFGPWPATVDDLSRALLEVLDVPVELGVEARLQRLEEVLDACGSMLEVLERDRGQAAEFQRYVLHRLRVRGLLDMIGCDSLNPERPDWQARLIQNLRDARRPREARPQDWESWDDARMLALSGKPDQAERVLDRVRGVSKARFEHDPLLPHLQKLGYWETFAHRMHEFYGSADEHEQGREDPPQDPDEPDEGEKPGPEQGEPGD